jgi:hypothetical protein
MTIQDKAAVLVPTCFVDVVVAEDVGRMNVLKTMAPRLAV